MEYLDIGTKEKLRECFMRMPSDFTFEEMQRLLEGYGYEKSDMTAQGKKSVDGSMALISHG